MPIGAMSVVIKGDIEDFNKNIAQLQKNLNKSTKGLQTVARNMTTAGDSMTKGVTLPILAVGAGLFKLGESFDEAYDKIRIGTGKTGKELENLNDDFRAVAKVAPSSFDDIGTAIAGLNQKLGLTGKPLQDLSVQVLNLSRITKTDLNTNIDNAAKLFNNWNIATKDQSKTLNLMFNAAQQTGVGVDKLMSEVTSSGPILRAMGYDLETSTALIAGFDKAGIDVGTTIAGMKKALVTMAKEGMSDPQEVLSTYITKIKAAGSDIEATGIAAELFGSKGGAAMAIAIREGRLNLDDLIASLKLGKDSINEAAKATEDWQEKLTRLRNKISLALEPLATKVFESVGRAIDEVTPKIEGLAKKFGELTPAMQDSLLAWAGMIAIGGPLVSFLGRAASGVINLYKSIVLMNAAGKGSILLKIAQYAPELALALGLVELQINSSAEAFKNFELVQTKLRDGMYLFSKAPEDVRIQMQMLQDKMKVVSEEGAEYLRQKMIALSNDFLTGKITAADLAHGLDLLNTSVIPTGKALEDLSNKTTDQKIAIQEHENAIVSLTAQYPDLTDVEIENKIAMDESIGTVESLAKAKEDLMQATNDLYGALFNEYLLNVDINEGLEEANKAWDEYIKSTKTHGSTFTANNAALQSYLSTNIDYLKNQEAQAQAGKNLAEVNANTESTTLQKLEAQDSYNSTVNAGNEIIAEATKKTGEYNSTGQQTAAQVDLTNEKLIEWVRIIDGLTSSQIPELINKTGALTGEEIKHLNGMQDQLDKAKELGIITPQEWEKISKSINDKIQGSVMKDFGDMYDKGTEISKMKIEPSIGLDTSEFYSKLRESGKAFQDAWNKYGNYSSGGIVKFSQGGILDKILSASRGINLPKFDSGGVLAMLHPPEIVLNKDQALNVLWNLAQQPVKNNQDTNKTDQKIEANLNVKVDLDGQKIFENQQKYIIRDIQRKVIGSGMR